MFAIPAESILRVGPPGLEAMYACYVMLPDRRERSDSQVDPG